MPGTTTGKHAAVADKIKIEAYILGGALIIKDPRRSGEYDRQSQWLVLPANDNDQLARASELVIAAAHIDTPLFSAAEVAA